MELLINHLFVFITSITGYQVPDARPSVEVMSSQEIRELYICANELDEATVQKPPLGLYWKTTDTVILNEIVDLSTIEGQGILTHELTHYLQDINGFYDKLTGEECGRPDEVEAYDVEARFLMASEFPNADYIQQTIYFKMSFSACLPIWERMRHRPAFVPPEFCSKYEDRLKQL